MFKSRLFFSSKKSDHTRSDSVNRPRSTFSDAPSRLNKKKLKSNSKSLSRDISDYPSELTGNSCKAQGKAGGRDNLVVCQDGTVESKNRNLEASGGEKLEDSCTGSGLEGKGHRSMAQRGEGGPASPILASSLGLNKIKTKSGPLFQDTSHRYCEIKGLGNLTRPPQRNNGSIKKEMTDAQGRMGCQEPGTGSDFNLHTFQAGASFKDQVACKTSETSGVSDSRWDSSRDIKCSESHTPEETESPRFQAMLRVTKTSGKKTPTDVKSFSHELNSKGVQAFPFWKPRGLYNTEEILAAIREKFCRAKDEVNTDLAIFAADLVGILEKNEETLPEWQERIEDLLVLARNCAMVSAGEFWLQCEGIVQELDDRRQDLSPGMLKQLHTRMLFILSRCTRLLQFHKENGLSDSENIFQHTQCRLINSADKLVLSSAKNTGIAMPSRTAPVRKYYSQEQHGFLWENDNSLRQKSTISSTMKINDFKFDCQSHDYRTSLIQRPSRKNEDNNDLLLADGDAKSTELKTVSRPSDLSSNKDMRGHYAGHGHKLSWGYWCDQQNSATDGSMICRICEEEVQTLHVEDHSKICAIADRCDQKGLSLSKRLIRISETLEKMVVSLTLKDVNTENDTPDTANASHSSVTEESDLFSPKHSDWSRRGSEDMLDHFPETEGSCFTDDLKGLPSMYKSRIDLKSDIGMASSSTGSLTPRSPLITPSVSHIDLLLEEKYPYSEHDDIALMNELADIARCVANMPLDDDHSMSYLLSCLEDLRVVIDRRKFDALTVQTFGTRIEKLIREKYLKLCELVEDERIDMTSSVIDEDAPLEDDVLRSLRASPAHVFRDRTCIDDFEIIKPISRGAFGRVFLAKKRTTGDLFAIKVLKKADMIRKNAVESIIAERDILISLQNPFVVRFFYSFTCRENLYLVMEYLNGGDLYSLLRNLGCLHEDVARIYIAEVVLALEYLHSLNVVHRDLKPDNLLIAHDGHIKLTDFGLSKVGLINSTDELSGPSSMFESEVQMSCKNTSHERLKKRSAVGTPDYLAPEILLGMGHGATADWWSVGVILFELIVGIPPFNAEHPQMIFDNILNCKIPWPQVPDEMSWEAKDLIDRLLTEDPNQRLGVNGASEVKQHQFFKGINWDTLARQKAAFVPHSESAFDTSYFASRYSWNLSGNHNHIGTDFEETVDEDCLSCNSSCMSDTHNDETGDHCGSLTELNSGSSVNYSFSNFSFKNLSQLALINYDLLSRGSSECSPANPA